MSVRYASRDVAERAASELSDEFLACREQHDWRMYYYKRMKKGYDRSWFCPRCKSEKHQFTDSEGYSEPASYNYSPGYKISGYGRMTGAARAAIRLEMLDRMEDFGGVQNDPEQQAV